MRNYVTINGVDSTSLAGFLIQELPPLSLPKMRTKTETIDGRDGDIITKLGYSAYDKEITIGLYGSYDIDKINEFFVSEGTIVFSNEPDKYYRFTMVDGIDYDRLVRFRTGKITFHCQPFKYDATETEIDFTNTFTEDNVPYIFRANTHDANMMKLKKVVGGTIAWNQGNPNPKFELGTTGYQGIGGTFTVTNGVAQVVINTALQYAYSCRIQRGVSASIKDHKYFVSAEATLSVNGKVRAYIGQMSGTPAQATVTANQYAELNTIYNCTTTNNGAISVSTGDDFAQRSIGDILYVRKMCVYDLTQMFGSTIADYIYSLEQAHAGDGVAWFKALFGEDYYPYNSGELISVKTSARKTYNADNVEIGSYPLDGDLTLRGIPKLDGNNELYYDGDTYASDGTVTRKYGVYTFTGNEVWSMYVAGGHNTFNSGNRFLTDGVPISGSAIMDSGYIKSSITYIGGMADKSFQFFSTPSFSVTDDSYTSATDFAQHMAGRILVYELATPTTESADAYTQSQRVGATEEFVDGRTVEIPVGNNTLYYDGTPEIVVKNKGNTTSRPTLTIYGEGTITVSLNGDEIFTITMGDHEYITIDTEEMNAYMGGVLLNRSVTGDYSSFVLNAGDNTISLSGNVSKVLIDNYSRWL